MAVKNILICCLKSGNVGRSKANTSGQGTLTLKASLESKFTEFSCGKLA